MSVSEDPRETGPVRRSLLVRIVRLILLVALGVGGYAAYQLVPAWLGFLVGSDSDPLRKWAGLHFVEAMLFAYPLALAASTLGTVVLVFVIVRSRSRARRGGFSAAVGTSLRARLLVLCLSSLLSLAALEAGAALWRSRLHQNPELSVVIPPPRVVSEGDSPGPQKDGEPDLPSRFNDQEAATAGAARPLRILVIGESSGRGEPYHPWLSVGQIVGWRLEKVFPGRPIEVDIWADGGAVLEIMHKKLADLTYRPDALIVYVGHNEYQGRYAWMRDVEYYVDGDRVSNRIPRFLAANSFLRFSPLCQLLEETRERQRLDTIPPHTVTRDLIDRPVCTKAESRALEDDFRRRLEAIAVYCESIRTLPIFIIPASNDAGWEPSRSVLPAETPRAERTAFARDVAHAIALEGKDSAEAIRIDRELLKRHPDFAETHFRLARLLEQTGRWVEAKDHYTQARELDGFPLRCPEPFRQVYRDVAARHPFVLLVDGPKVLEAKSRHGFTDAQFFHDAQHPNLRGYVALAEDLMKQLGARRAFGWPAEMPVPIVDVAACVRHFGIDSARWAQIASREAWFFRVTAYIRYDPQFRNQIAADYDQAEAAIKAGREPALAAMPGWPVPPRPSSSHRIPRRASQQP